MKFGEVYHAQCFHHGNSDSRGVCHACIMTRTDDDFYPLFVRRITTTDTLTTPSPWDSADAVIAEAVRVTSADRHESYAPPEENFARIAQVWNGLLDEKLHRELNAADVARCMAGMKLVRDAHKPSRDNRVDCVGYVRCLERAEPTDAE